MIEQRVGVGWRCDGCGKVDRWGPGWGVYGSFWEEDQGLLRWVSCSKACKDLIPAALRELKIRVHPIQGLPHGARERVAQLRATAGWRARGDTPSSAGVAAAGPRLVEGTVHKGGLNRTYQITERPPDPARHAPAEGSSLIMEQLALTQRWFETEEAWRPGAEPIATNRYEIAPIPDDRTARTFVLRHHYSGSYPAARFRFGLWRGDALEGVAVFSVPMSLTSFGGLPLSAGRAGVELGRLVLLNRVPGNGESWFVSRCFDLLRREGVEGVVSFSDPLARERADGSIVHPGHVGIVYQALSATYTGRSKPDTVRLLPDGSVFHRRAQSKIRNGERGAKGAIRRLLELGAPPFDRRRPAAWLEAALEDVTRPMPHPGNHRYLWALDRRLRRHLPTPQAYPAPPGGRAAPKWGRKAA